MNFTCYLLVCLSLLELSRGIIHYFATRFAIERLAGLTYTDELPFFVGLVGAENISTAVRTAGLAVLAVADEKKVAAIAFLASAAASILIAGNTAKGKIGEWEALVIAYGAFALLFIFRVFHLLDR